MGIGAGVVRHDDDRPAELRVLTEPLDVHLGIRGDDDREIHTFTIDPKQVLPALRGARVG